MPMSMNFGTCMMMSTEILSKEVEYLDLKHKIKTQQLGYHTDEEVVAWATYYTLAEELNHKAQLF